MKTQTTTWTALPNGLIVYRDATRLRLSAFVSPRLDTDVTPPALSLFPDFLDWPKTLLYSSPDRGLTFHVQFGTQNPIPATRIGDKPRSDLWQALFPASTLVKPYKYPDFKNRPIQSYPAGKIQAFLKQQYVTVATTSGEDFPSADGMVKDQGAPFKPLAFSLRENDEAKLTTQIMQDLDRNRYNTTGSINNPEELAKAFLQAKLFHKPFSNKRVAIKRPEIDFHRMISLLGDYPVLLRSLGLVHDLEVPLPKSGDYTVQVFVSWGPPDPSVTTINIPNDTQRFETRCRITSNSFRALPRAANPELVDGMLPFENKERFEVVRIDTDGAALKTLGFANNVGMARTIRKTDDTPDTSALPSLRSGGISVVRLNRAEQTHGSFDRQDLLNQNLQSKSHVTLDAEDITRGFAIDVWDIHTKKWHSLCQRVGTYEFSRPFPAITEKAEDEGCVSASLTSAADGSSDICRQGEALFRWWGWSLSAPRPGKTLDAEGKPMTPKAEIDPEYKLSVHFTAKPCSLPRLRFGTTYRLRARAVDLAGNRRAVDDKTLPDDLHATETMVYGRYEPVSPPAVVMRNRRTEGDSVERLVIRSNYDEPIQAETERHIVPPKSAQSLAEDHGLFDDKNNGQVDASAYNLIIAREGGEIQGTPDPDNYDRPYVDSDSIALPYLPDLPARGAALRNLPGATDPLLIDFGYAAGLKWPDMLPFRLVLGENDTVAVKYDDAARVLKVLLPKAEMIRLRLSSYMSKDDAWLMGLVQWIIESGIDETQTVKLAARGSHWMLTPYRVLTLVHAVRQPILTPEFSDQFGRMRVVGQTHVNLYDRMMRTHRKSTIKLDVVGVWNETIDPLAETGPRVISAKARPFELAVSLPNDSDDEEMINLEGRHEFGDTKYRSITYSAIATTRFGEYFLERNKNVTLVSADTFTLDTKGVVESSEAVRLTDNTANYQRFDARNKTGDYVMDYASGTIRRTKPAESVSAIPEDTKLEVTYLVPPITRQMTQPKTVDILSSARPAAPKVLYAVPTFTWQMGIPSLDRDKISSQRMGGGIRIYLERPWFTSGDGELLGVIIWPNPANVSLITQPPPEKVKSYITHWGMDPLYQSKATDPCPNLGAFKLSKPEHRASGLVLEEVPDDKVRVNVAGHEVAYDSDRKLWYCDINIDAGDSYFPFVRLALARYQPNSLSRAITGVETIVDATRDNVHLSRVVLADFIQLAPDRFASITRDGSSKLVRHVTVTGASYKMLNGQPGPSQMEVSLEKMRPGVKPDVAGELAWEPISSTLTSNSLALSNQLDKSGSTVWSGDITLPDGTETYRLVIKEFELYLIPGMVPLHHRRLVYADTIELKP
jgi:hypothetical protein